MTDEPGPRMPPDWRPPQRVLLEQRWADHRQHDRLVELARERSPRRGEPAWVLEQEPERYSRDWTVVWFRPIDPRDERQPIRICRYPMTGSPTSTRESRT